MPQTSVPGTYTARETILSRRRSRGMDGQTGRSHSLLGRSGFLNVLGSGVSLASTRFSIALSP